MRLEQIREIVWKCNLELPKNDQVKIMKNGMQL
jgi:hypothetical protein